MIKIMSLRVKVVLFICSVNVLAIIVLNLFSHRSLVSKIFTFEEREIEQDLRLVKKATETEIDRIDTSAKDYAYWDDTYEFMRSKSQEYINTNLTAETFGIIGIQYFLLVDTNGDLFYVNGFDSVSNTSLIPSEGFNEAITRLSDMVYSENLNGSGILNADDKFYLVVIRPVLTSNKEGPSRGTLMMLRELDAEILASIRDNTQVAFELKPFEKVTTSLDKITLATLMDRGYVLTNNADKISGLILLESVDMRPVLTISVENSKQLSKIASSNLLTMNRVSIYILIFSVLCGVAFMEMVIVRPIKSLVAEIDKVRTRKIASQRLTVKASGEMQVLVTNINSMLETLDTFDKKLVEVNTQLEAKAKEVQISTQETERLNKHMVGREMRMAELKDEIEDLKFKLNQKNGDKDVGE